MASQGLKPKKHLGQVFLKNKKIVEQIIKSLTIKPNDLIIEIGPGTGVLTEKLIKTKATIIAIEKDIEMIKILNEKFKNVSNLKIIQEDIREVLKEEKNLLNLNLPHTNYKLVGNIPYYLTNYLFRLLIEIKNKPKLIVLMVQKEVALRIASKPPQMSFLAVLLQLFFKIEKVASVLKFNFWPIPKVDSIIIKMKPLKKTTLPDTEKEKFIYFLKASFSHPRKLLIKNISSTLKLKKNKILSIFKKLKIPPTKRAQEVGLKQWLKLFNLLKHCL